ncbi:hypothetical protein Bbelb_031540 [Branchiostoma belcheri]|nr:hypothetical protein Bbelb_031540 [Branchiostoma belcheri]
MSSIKSVRPKSPITAAVCSFSANDPDHTLTVASLPGRLPRLINFYSRASEEKKRLTVNPGNLFSTAPDFPTETIAAGGEGELDVTQRGQPARHFVPSYLHVHQLVCVPGPLPVPAPLSTATAAVTLTAINSSFIR